MIALLLLIEILVVYPFPPAHSSLATILVSYQLFTTTTDHVILPQENQLPRLVMTQESPLVHREECLVAVSYIVHYLE